MSMGNEQLQHLEDEFASAPSSFDSPNEQQQPEQAPAPAAAAEPFEGFNALPEAVRQRWTESEAQRKQYETDLAQARREASALKGKVPGLERELAKYRKDKPAQAAPASPSGQQVPAEAWEAFKAQFPDEAKAYEQYQARMAAEIGGKLSPLEQRLQEQAEKLERIERMAHEAESEAIQESLDEHFTDWRVIAGWETQDGQQGDGNWHPEFQAWLDNLPSKARAQADELLVSRDPDDIAHVIYNFKRDYLILLQEEEAAAPQQPQPRPRLAATRDVMPSNSGNGLGSAGSRGGNPAEDAWVAALASDQARDWLKQANR